MTPRSPVKLERMMPRNRHSEDLLLENGSVTKKKHDLVKHLFAAADRKYLEGAVERHYGLR
jgi:hypothetical protein